MLRLFIFSFLIVFSNLVFAKEIQVTVHGMVCGFCSQGISKKFSSDPAVDQVQVDMNTQVVILKLKNDQDIQDDKINELVRDAGFTPIKIQR